MPRSRLQSVARVLVEQVARQLVSCWADDRSKAQGGLCLDMFDKVGTGRIYKSASETLWRECDMTWHRKADRCAI